MHAGAYVPVYAPQPDGHGPPPAVAFGKVAADHEDVRVVVIDMYADDDAD